jgi:RecJ-like exonuclease
MHVDKCVVIAHGDCDGVCSAALAVAYLVEKCEVSVYFSHPVGLLQDLREFAKQGSFVVVVDIAVNELHAGELVKYIEELAKSRHVLYIDHHPPPEDFKYPSGSTWIYDPRCSASELIYKYLHKLGLSDEYGRVALYGAICDYLDETPWVKNELLKWDRRSVFLEAGIVSQGLEGARRDYEFKRAVVEHLARNRLPSQMSELVARSIKQAELDEKLRLWVKENLKVKGQVAYVLNPPGSVGRAANYARIYGGVRVGVAVEERRELYIMSLRSVDFDLNKALRRISKKLGIHGGGHPLAAGARVPKQLFETFIEELNREIASSQ